MAAAVNPEISAWAATAVAADICAINLCRTLAALQPIGAELDFPAASRRHRREIAITIDDGPNPAVTPAVLDLLDRYQRESHVLLHRRKGAALPGLMPGNSPPEAMPWKITACAIDTTLPY